MSLIYENILKLCVIYLSINFSYALKYVFAVNFIAILISSSRKKDFEFYYFRKSKKRSKLMTANMRIEEGLLLKSIHKVIRNT